MAKISFKAKVRDHFDADGVLIWRTIGVPIFTRHHCDMSAFRHHAKYGGLANSDLFPNILSRIRRDVFKGKDYFRVDQIPEGVSVDTSTFLAVVSFDA